MSNVRNYTALRRLPFVSLYAAQNIIGLHLYVFIHLLYQVRLHSPSGEPFNGYQVRAMQVGGNEEQLLGSFVDIPENTKLQAWYPDDLEERVRMRTFIFLRSIYAYYVNRVSHLLRYSASVYKLIIKTPAIWGSIEKRAMILLIMSLVSI